MSKLSYKLISAEEAPDRLNLLYVLHGFLGSGRNWASFGRQLADVRTDWAVALVDLRLHGESPSMAGPHSIRAAAEDLAALDSELGGERIVALLGHSLGGKVVLEATRILHPPPVQTWVIDSTPAASRTSATTSQLLARLVASPARFADRAAAVAWITEGGFSLGTARWVAMNLERVDDGWAWRPDLKALGVLLEDFGESDLWEVVESAPTGAEVHLVKARDESIVTPSDLARLDAAGARGEPVVVHELDGGHWLHIDNPMGLLDLVAGALPRT